jgi:mevalonate kinase
VSERNDHEHLPPPIGVHHEQPMSTGETLKQLQEQDPDYVRWVLFRSEELMNRLEECHQSGVDPRETDLKENIAELLVEAHELIKALQLNKELRKLFEAS